MAALLKRDLLTHVSFGLSSAMICQHRALTTLTTPTCPRGFSSSLPSRDTYSSGNDHRSLSDRLAFNMAAPRALVRHSLSPVAAEDPGLFSVAEEAPWIENGPSRAQASMAVVRLRRIRRIR
ncbi:hypothetical protein FB45DRAFT_162780 [Roridomyces roridus]|uniref:Uncharacterized protein n=1 Tax=Roridomyces roridus TaxID=1738132 RepID=A0AAD7FES8_9AGAR|nr:hypothetical protein FB45DRAFT_162780 [Roridomyces roridus]